MSFMHEALGFKWCLRFLVSYVNPTRRYLRNSTHVACAFLDFAVLGFCVSYYACVLYAVYVVNIAYAVNAVCAAYAVACGLRVLDVVAECA